jgi:SAM-dependent methyltransferase
MSSWVDLLPRSTRVLDLGCGAGWTTQLFAKRFAYVVGIEQSKSLVKAARDRFASYSTVEIREGKVQTDIPYEFFDLIFAGGIFTYLNDQDSKALLETINDQLHLEGVLIMRESTVPSGKVVVTGEYSAIYRSVDTYSRFIEEAGLSLRDIRRNRGYTSLKIAKELISKLHTVFPRTKSSPLLSSCVWYFLRCLSPLSFRALPLVLTRLGVNWPISQNHFLLIDHSDNL